MAPLGLTLHLIERLQIERSRERKKMWGSVYISSITHTRTCTHTHTHKHQVSRYISVCLCRSITNC